MKKERLKKGDELPLYCKNCRKETKCTYIGIQTNHKGKPTLNLFNCLECKTTFAEKIKKR